MQNALSQKKEYIEPSDLVGRKIFTSHRGIVQGVAQWFGEYYDKLNIFATYNLLYNAAMCEIYLRPFELAVKEGKSSALMSSFIRVGTVWAGGCYELLTEILRNEWGFEGMVVTDYANSYMNPDQMIRAGGDLCLFQDQQPSAKGTSSHFTALYKATKNILYTVANSNAMNGMGEGIVYYYALPYWKIVLIVVDVAVAAGCAVWGFFAIRKSCKKLKNQADQAE